MLVGGFSFSFIRTPWDIGGIWDLQTFMSIGFIIFIGTLLAFYAYMSAIKIVGAQKASLLVSAEPVIAVILSVIWLRTTFVVIDWIGCICIISTLFLLNKDE